ncbi:MAG UNVERIFIED_CONTAM: DUF4981 domain-containing protein, partial [Staphylococcus saprophyticus]
MATGSLDLPIVPAGQSAEISLPEELFQHNVHPAYLTITLEQRGKVEWDEGTYAVAWTQALVSQPTEQGLVNGLGSAQSALSTNSTKTTI